jgi:hypothetical protein
VIRSPSYWPAGTVNSWSTVPLGAPGAPWNSATGGWTSVSFSITAPPPTNGRVDGPICHLNLPLAGTVVVVSSSSCSVSGGFSPVRQSLGRPVSTIVSSPFSQYGLVLVSNFLCSRSTLPDGAVPRRTAWSAPFAAASAAISIASRRPPRPLACSFSPVHSFTTPVS